MSVYTHLLAFVLYPASPPKASCGFQSHQWAEQQVGQEWSEDSGNGAVRKVRISLEFHRPHWGKQLCVHLSEIFISGCRRTLWRSRGVGVQSGSEKGFLQASCDIYADVSHLYLFCAFETPSCAPLTDVSALKSGQLPAGCLASVATLLFATRTHLPSRSSHLRLYPKQPSRPWSPPLSALSPPERSSEGTV